MRKIGLASLMLIFAGNLQSVTAQDIQIPKRVQVDVLSGKWTSIQWTLDVWVLDLKAAGSTVTGTISIQPGPGRPSSPSVVVFDGKIDKGQVEFKAKSPDNLRVITFSGTIAGDQIRFTRKVEMQPGASAGGDDLLGANGPQKFAVKRERLPSKNHIDQ